MKLNQYICRDIHDEDIFHVGFNWRSDIYPKTTRARTAFQIHIDDIDGMFGEDVLMAAREMDKGDTRIIFIEGAFDDE